MCPSFQKVSLVNTTHQQPSTGVASRLQQSTSSPKFLHLDLENGRRKIPLSDCLKVDVNDDSSPEESSYRVDDFPDEFDDEPLHMNLSESKSNVNGNISKTHDNLSKNALNFKKYARIPEYSVAEENRNVRSFHSITLPDGKTREIDMKVKYFFHVIFIFIFF